MVTRVCFSLIAENVYAGQTPEQILAVSVSKQVFNTQYDCVVVEAHVEHDNGVLRYVVYADTPFGRKKILYTFQPGIVNRVIYSS